MLQILCLTALKKCLPDIAPVITYIIQKSSVPGHWGTFKKSLIAPISSKSNIDADNAELQAYIQLTVSSQITREKT